MDAKEISLIPEDTELAHWGIMETDPSEYLCVFALITDRPRPMFCLDHPLRDQASKEAMMRCATDIILWIVKGQRSPWMETLRRVGPDIVRVDDTNLRIKAIGPFFPPDDPNETDIRTLKQIEDADWRIERGLMIERLISGAPIGD